MKNKLFDINRLQRVTTSSKVIPEIDGLRFLAIISVVILHLRTHFLRTATGDFTVNGFFQNINDLISNGGFGVNIFFGISGFILALPFANQYMFGGREVNLKAYYLRRLTRLEPPYIIVMTIFFFASVLLLNNSFQLLLPHYLASLIYSHFFIYGEWSVINPVAWSLETEVQFYILAPLIFMIFKLKNKGLRLSLMAMVVVVFTGLLFKLLDTYIEFHLYKSLLAYLPYFAIGILFADIYLNYLNGKPRRRNHIWDIIGIGATFTIFLVNPNNGFLLSLANLLCLLLIFISTFRGRWLNYFYTRKFVYITGGMCYTIYLIHYGFIALIMQYTSRIGFDGSLMLNLMVQAIIILPLLFIISSLFFLLFEKPFMYKDWPSHVVSFVEGSKNWIFRK